MKRVLVRKTVRRRAFTLLEVLMVIVILGVLAALIVPQFGGTQDRAKKDSAALQIKNVEQQLEVFKTHCGRYPTGEEGLAVLLTKPDSEEFADKWAGPYLKAAAIDPWNNPLQYRSPGQYNTESFDLWSNGKDGAEGSDDDVVNWKK